MTTTFTSSDSIYEDRASREAALARLDALSRLFDIAFAIPGTNVRFGIEAILRLVPGSSGHRRRCRFGAVVLPDL
jgi:hypothetical protein